MVKWKLRARVNANTNEIGNYYDQVPISRTTHEWLNKYGAVLFVISMLGGIKMSLFFVNSGIFGWKWLNMGLHEHKGPYCHLLA